MKYNYKLLRSKRRTLSLEISKELEIIVRAPRSLSLKIIEIFISKHEVWIGNHLGMQKRRNETERALKLSDAQISELKSLAKERLSQKVEHYSHIMELAPTGISITAAEKRFGSCSGKNRLCFSYRLMMYPDKAIDYVVVHELAHIKHHNHSKEFYALIEQYLPDYKAREAMLKNN